MQDFFHTMLNRHSIRKYAPGPVNDELLNEILTLGCRASTTGNMQVYSIIITRDAEMKKQLLPLHFGQKMITEAPVVLTFCADFNRFSQWCRYRNAQPGYDNFLSFVTAAIDALIVCQTVCVAAEARGLGICYLGTTTYMAKGISAVLNLPKGVVPVTTITLGWPAENPEDVGRLPLSAVIHNETYSDYTEEMLNEFYREKEERADSRQFVKENNKETLAQVFTDIRYKKVDNEHFSRQLIEFLKEQGFVS